MFSVALTPAEAATTIPFPIAAQAFPAVDNCTMRIPGTGHACRYGASSFFGLW